MGFKRLLGHRGRRYPITRDSRGKSARKRCFELFEDQVPSEHAGYAGWPQKACPAR
jgi:hypothetical protein